MIAKIICPKCQTMGQFSVEGGSFKGPYRCWKCRTLYTLDMANSEVISLQPLTEEEFKQIKAEQEAQKKGHTSGGGMSHTTPQSLPEHAAEPVVWPKVENRNTGSSAPNPDSQLPPEHRNNPVIWPKVSNMNVEPHTDPQTPPAHENNPVIWPKVPNKVVEDNTAHEFPEQSFKWPNAQRGGADLSTESGKASETSQTSFVPPRENTQKSSNGVILFQSIAILTEAEKVLNNEGCTITRITAPSDLPSGSNIALRFPWSQYETVKASLDKAGVKAQLIKQL